MLDTVIALLPVNKFTASKLELNNLNNINPLDLVTVLGNDT